MSDATLSLVHHPGVDPQPSDRDLALHINAPGTPHMAVVVTRDDLARVLAGERVNLRLHIAA